MIEILVARDLVWLRALRYGVGAGVEHCRALRLLGPCMTVVDIGANRGQFALAARHEWRDATIFSFEPIEEPANLFEAVFAGDPRVSLHRKAIGRQVGKATIHISRRDDSSSLLPASVAQTTIFPGTEQTYATTIDIDMLSNQLTEADIIAPALFKLDVQGFELEALRGAGPLLACFDFVYCECSFIELYKGQALAQDVITWLHERGFALRGIYHLSYDASGAAVQGDFLFIRVDRPNSSQRISG